MRILATADIHGVVSVYEWLVRVVDTHRAELVILAGDLFAGDVQEGQREQARTIVPLLKKVSAPVFYVMGNDDSFELDIEDERNQFLHGKRVEWSGYNFVGYQHTLPFMGGIFEKPEEQIEQDLHKLAPLLDARTVLVTHGPSHGVLDMPYGSKEHVGSRSLAALLQHKPVLAHIHGHIHESFGREGSRFNVAAAGRKRATLVELPALAHEVIQG